MTAFTELRAALAAVEADPGLSALLEEAKAAVDRAPEVRVKVAEAVGRTLLELRERRIQLGQIEAYVESVLARVMPVGSLDFPDLHLERKGGRDRKEWDHDGVVAALAQRFAADADTGEVDPTLVPLYEHAVHHFLQSAQVTGYRTKTGLVPLGVDPDDYSKSERGRRTVHVTGSAAAVVGEAGAA